MSHPWSSEGSNKKQIEQAAHDYSHADIPNGSLNTNNRQDHTIAASKHRQLVLLTPESASMLNSSMDYKNGQGEQDSSSHTPFNFTNQAA